MHGESQLRAMHLVIAKVWFSAVPATKVCDYTDFFTAHSDQLFSFATYPKVAVFATFLLAIPASFPDRNADLNDLCAA